MKKVLIIENSLYVTGGMNAILSSIERLRNEYEFHFIIPEKSRIAPLIESRGYKLAQLPFLEISKSIRILFYLPRLYKNARKVLRYMKQEGIDILHVNDVFNMVGCMVKRLDPSIKLVNHVRLLKTSYIAPLYPFFTKEVIKYADAVICVSEAVKNDISATGKAVVIYDTPAINNNHGDWKGLTTPKEIRILYLGNYVRGKGQQHGLKAFIEFQKKYPASRITFAGQENDAASLQFKNELIELAQKAGVAPKVTFGGKVVDVEKEMKSHDVVLNLSESESFSFVCLEAILYGVPLVAANSGGPAEITNQGQMAFLVENKNCLSAATALEYIVEHPQEVCKKAQLAKRWAEEKFATQKGKIQLKDIYDHLN